MMKNYTQKFMSLLVALVLIFSLLPYPTAYATEIGGVQVKLNQILSDYPSGSYFTVNGKACTHSILTACTNCSLLSISKAKGKSVPSGQGDAWTCVAFASYVMNQVFGTKLSGNIEQIGSGKKDANQASTYKDARIGDLIYFYNSSGKFTHVAVCMGTTSDSIILYECNATGKTAEISYRTIPYSQVSAHRSGVYITVYRAKNYDEINGVTSSVTITFDPNGGSTSQTSKTVAAGSTVGTLPTPTKDGYTFDGWYTQENGGSKITTSTKVNLTSAQTFYAHWTQNAVHEHVKSNATVTSEHPHYVYYTCTVCGEVFTDGTTMSQPNSCTACALIGVGECSIESATTPPSAPKVKIWSEWSGWSTTPVYATDTREVETKVESQQVKISDGYTEYRYGGYVTSDGKHECWCETYLRSKFGSANLRYSDWSTTRYSANGSKWTCGFCNGNHIHVNSYGTDGRAYWLEYTLSDGKDYYWEESRTVAAQYETQSVTLYRYRDVLN